MNIGMNENRTHEMSSGIIMNSISIMSCLTRNNAQVIDFAQINDINTFIPKLIAISKSIMLM